MNIKNLIVFIPPPLIDAFDNFSQTLVTPFLTYLLVFYQMMRTASNTFPVDRITVCERKRLGAGSSCVVSSNET